MSLDISQLYARANAQGVMPQQAAPAAGPQGQNTRGGTAWMQQYAPRMGTAPGGPMTRPNAGMGAAPGIGGYNQRLGAPGTANSGLYQRPVGQQGNPNMQQLSPQAMAMLAEFRRRATLTSPQRMVEDRGVFAGQQQMQPMAPPPSMNLPQLWAGG